MKFAICLSLALFATVVVAFEARTVDEDEILHRDKRGLFDFIVHAKDILEGVGTLAKGIEDAIKKVAVVVDKVQGHAAVQAAAAGLTLPSQAVSPAHTSPPKPAAGR